MHTEISRHVVNGKPLIKEPGEKSKCSVRLFLVYRSPGNMMFIQLLQVTVLLLVVIGTTAGQYEASGWRPSGKLLNIPSSSHQFGDYNYPSGIDTHYGTPYKHDSPTTTVRSTTTSTTPKIREPTTPSNEIDEEQQSNPALAIANSFAFNRPVYVYTGFPFHPGFTYLK